MILHSDNWEISKSLVPKVIRVVLYSCFRKSRFPGFRRYLYGIFWLTTMLLSAFLIRDRKNRKPGSPVPRARFANTTHPSFRDFEQYFSCAISAAISASTPACALRIENHLRWGFGLQYFHLDDYVRGGLCWSRMTSTDNMKWQFTSGCVC